MTIPRKFEALLCSQNLAVIRQVLDIIESFPIAVDVCMLPARAADLLAKHEFDLLVLDCEEGNHVDEVAAQCGPSRHRQRMTIAALVQGSAAQKTVIQAVAHVLLPKPLNSRSRNLYRNLFRNLVYARMVQESIQENGHTLGWTAAAKDDLSSPAPATMTDLNENGVRLLHMGNLLAGDLLKFKVFLSSTNRTLHFDARIRWTARNRSAEADFMVLSAPDADVLREWPQQNGCGEILEAGSAGVPCATTVPLGPTTSCH